MRHFMHRSILGLILFAASACATTKNEEVFVYSNLDDYSKSLVIFGSLEKAAFTDVLTEVTKCSTLIRCIQIEDLVIARPEEGESLQVDEKVVTNVGEWNIDLIGRTYALEVISVKHAREEQRYFYHDSLGLVAFKLTLGSESSFFVLRGRKGLWAK